MVRLRGEISSVLAKPAGGAALLKSIHPAHRVAEVMLRDEIGKGGELVGETFEFLAVGRDRVGEAGIELFHLGDDAGEKAEGGVAGEMIRLTA